VDQARAREGRDRVKLMIGLGSMVEALTGCREVAAVDARRASCQLPATNLLRDCAACHSRGWMDANEISQRPGGIEDAANVDGHRQRACDGFVTRRTPQRPVDTVLH